MAELEVNQRQAGDVTILDMNGAVRIGEGSITLRDAIRGLADEGKKKIILNLLIILQVDFLIVNKAELTVQYLSRRIS